MSFFTSENLQSLVFDNNKELYDHLKVIANREGFDLASRQPLSSPYGMFYCRKKGRIKREKTNKCGCCFQFKSTNINGKIRIRIDASLELLHNRPLNPSIYSHKLLPDDQRNDYSFRKC